MVIKYFCNRQKKSFGKGFAVRAKWRMLKGRQPNVAEPRCEVICKPSGLKSKKEFRDGHLSVSNKAMNDGDWGSIVDRKRQRKFQ